MGEFYVLPVHAAQALGVRVDQLNLPASGYGVDGDALWVDPRFIEVRRSRAAIAAQLSAHRHEIHINIGRRAAAILKVELKRARQVERRRRQRERENLLPPEEIERRQLHRKYMRQRRKGRQRRDRREAQAETFEVVWYS
jgi:hypothetical protein